MAQKLENFKHQEIPEIDEDFFVALKNQVFAIEHIIKSNPDFVKLKDLFSQKITKSGFKIEVIQKNEFHKRITLRPDFSEAITSGIYILMEKKDGLFNPVYVGITKRIKDRFQEHSFGKTTKDTTLPHSIHSHEKNDTRKYKDLDAYIENFNIDVYTERIRNMHVYLIPEPDFYRLNLLEVLLAARLKTIYNTFEPQ